MMYVYHWPLLMFLRIHFRPYSDQKIFICRQLSPNKSVITGIWTLLKIWIHNGNTWTPFMIKLTHRLVYTPSPLNWGTLHLFKHTLTHIYRYPFPMVSLNGPTKYPVSACKWGRVEIQGTEVNSLLWTLLLTFSRKTQKGHVHCWTVS